MAEPSDPAKNPDAKSAKADSKSKTDKKASAATPPVTPAKSAEAKKTAQTSCAAKSSSVPSGGSAKPSAPAASTEKTGGGGRGFLTFIIVIILIGGGAYATRDVWMPEVQSRLPAFMTGTANSTSETVSAVDVLASRVASLEKSLAGSNSDTPMAALKQESVRVQSELNKALARIDDLERKLSEVRALASAVTSSTGGDIDLGPVLSRLDELEQRDQSRNSEVASLNQKLQSIETNSTGGASGQGVVLAVAQLRDAAMSGRPYSAQLFALQSIGSNSPDVIGAASQLTTNADSGLPTLHHLQTQFSSIVGDIVSLARINGGDWLDQAAGKISALVALRRTDGSSGDPVEDAVANIEAHLNDRDIIAAVKTADALSELLQSDARNILEPWLLDAKARATAERALNAMHASALAALEK
jgi:hypothetical protein